MSELELSKNAILIWALADRAAPLRKNRVVIFEHIRKESRIPEVPFYQAFEELCDAGVVPGNTVATVIPFEGECPIREEKRLPGHKWKVLRERVLERDQFTCRYCGRSDERMHCDHVVPVSRGGSNDIENLVAACAPCNIAKRDRLVSEWVR